MRSNPSPRWYRWVVLSVALLTGATLALPSTVLGGATVKSGHGVLDVSTQPAVPAPISVNGLVRNTGEIRGLELPVGDHVVTFGAVPGYVGPPSQTVSVSEGEAISVVGEFQPAGILEVQVEPENLAPTVTVNGVERDKAPVLLELGEGVYEVCVDPLAGYDSTDCLEADVAAGKKTSLSFTYSPSTDDAIDEGPTDNSSLTRVDEGLVALYDFSEPSGAYVADVAGVSEGMDLTVQNPSAVTWTSDGLRFDQATIARTSGAPKAFYDSVAVTGEFTVEAWITPANTSQDGPARIATLSKDTKSQNFLLGQDRDSIQVRSGERKGNWRWNTTSGSVTTELTHVVMSHAADRTMSVYLDGVLAGREKMSSGPDSWDDSYSFAIGMEFNNRREWFGTYHLVALYGTALDANDVERNYTIGPDVNGSADAPKPETEPNELAGDEGGPADSNEESGGEVSEGQPESDDSEPDRASELPERGPSGRWPANTPAYDTPADVTLSSLEELPSALAQASSGDVIEIEPTRLSTDMRWGTPVTGGSLDWEQNVLVRPKLGQRGSVIIADHQFSVQTKGVTFAGLRVERSVRLDGAERTNLVWTELGPNGRTNITGGKDVRLIEPVRAEVGTIGQSAMHTFRAMGNDDLVNVSVEGAWLNTNVDAKDNLQTLAPTSSGLGDIRGLTIQDSVLFTGWDKMFQMNVGPHDFVFRNNWADACSTTEVGSSMWAQGGRGECTGRPSMLTQTRGLGGEVTHSVVLGTIRHFGEELTVLDSILRRVVDSASPGEFVIDDSNTIDASFDATQYPPPSLPDLDSIWHR